MVAIRGQPFSPEKIQPPSRNCITISSPNSLRSVPLELVEMGKDATIDHLLSELSVVDRLDGMIDRCLKRLLFVRGLKSIAPSSSTAPEQLRNKGRAAA